MQVQNVTSCVPTVTVTTVVPAQPLGQGQTSQEQAIEFAVQRAQQQLAQDQMMQKQAMQTPAMKNHAMGLSTLNTKTYIPR